MSAAELVRATRGRHRLTQGELAHRCATSQAQISRIERGDISPSVDTLARILGAMGERLGLSATPGPLETRPSPTHGAIWHSRPESGWSRLRT